MTQMTYRVALFTTLVLALTIVPISLTVAQAPPPSEQMRTMSFGSPIAPEFKYSRNMAILDRFGVNTFNNQFEYFAYDSNFYLIVKELQTGLGNDPDTSCYRFYDVTDPSQPVRLGRINLPDTVEAGDIETFQYGDTTRLIFYTGRDSSHLAGYDLYLDVLVGTDLMDDRIMNGFTIAPSDYQNATITTHLIWNANKWNEMIVGHDHHLLLATNLDILRIVDLSTKTMFDLKPVIKLDPLPSSTQQTGVKNHEVKAFTRANGDILVGVGVVSTGMRILTLNSNWDHVGTLAQNYDNDRALLPSTILNPTKMLWDSTTYQPLGDLRNNKWDYRVCHSVVPYDDATGNYVITIDEFTSSNSGQYQNGQWIPAIWESLDFYALNKCNDASYVEYPVYYDGQPVLLANGQQMKNPGWDRFDEPDTLRLNYAHRNHPKHLGVDPLRLQGAFLRLWNRENLGTNDTTINDAFVLKNAYDAQESDTHPEGYIGVDNIPEVCDVPTGLHEPCLVGNTLYLAGYNTGARILRLDGSEITVRGYCRTEPFLSNDTSDANFYMRPDIIMYAKGFYRYVPDQNRPGITYGSDPYNGMWTIQFFDSTLTDTLKHIAFQDRISIGTIDPSNELTFHLAEGGAVIADSAVVEFVDNTHFKWDSWDSLVVNGELYVGSVTFDSTFAPSKLYCAGGGTIVLGGAGKTITGLRNIHVADGGTVIVRDGTRIEGSQEGSILVEGRLILESCLLGESYTILVRGNGHLDIDTGATVTGVQLITIADMDSRMILGPGSTVEMRPGAVIRASGIIETDPNSWCRLQAMGASPDSLVMADQCWFGLELDWQVDANTNIRNMFVHHGWPGIWVNDGSPTITDCQFSNNMIGLTLTQGAATVTDNTFRENALVGLNCHSLAYSAPSDNRINSNGNIGLNLQACTNHWYSNTLDSNLVGAMVYDNSSMTFNQWASQNPRTMCDTTHGNGIRFNTTGVGIQGNSSTEFQCDNSVYGNYDWSAGGGRDLSINDQCRIVGWGNYPDSIPGVTADTLKFLKVGSAILQWSDPSNWNPSPSTDPVLMKTTVSPFRAALARAQSAARLGFFHSAQTDFSLAATEAMAAEEYLECLHSWRQMVVVTEQDSVNARAGSRNVYWTSMRTALAGNAAYADSAWKRNISNEILSVELVRKRDTTQALNVLATLTGNGIPAEYRRRALLRYVYTYSCLMNDYPSAMNRYQSIAQTFPGSLEQFEAKLILRLPIDSSDVASLQKITDFQNAHEHQTWAQPAWIAIDGPAPNPATQTTAFTVRTERSVRLRIDVYDIAGKSLLTVFDGSLAGGMHRIPFDGSMLPAGVRLYRATGHDVESGAPVTIEGKFIVVR